MINLNNKNISIGSVVAELPKAGQVFDKHGIDFCCGGHRLLDEVITQQGLDRSAIYKELDVLQMERENNYKNITFTEMSPSALTNYIEDTHHSYLRKVLPDISDLLSTILRVHGINHSELFELYRVFGVLKTELEQHLLKEETMLFPVVSEQEGNKETIIRLTTDIIREHEAAGELLSELRKITEDYKFPQDVCGTYIRTYEMLEELEKDLHQHIHLENNILLKEFDIRMVMK